MLAASLQDIILAVVAAVLSVHAAGIVVVAAYLIRTREKVTRLEEWQRLTEKRLNGTRD